MYQVVVSQVFFKCVHHVPHQAVVITGLTVGGCDQFRKSNALYFISTTLR